MNTPTPLVEADILQFKQNKSVVRLFRDGRWYAGRVDFIVLCDNKLCITLAPMIRFGHFVEPPETMDVTHQHLITKVDMPIKGSCTVLSEQFQLPDPMKTNSKYRQEGVLYVESANGTATISTHEEDISSVESLFEREKTPIEKYDD